MQSQVVRYVISRTKLDDVKSLLQSWEFLDKDDVRNLDLKHKNNVIQQVISACEDKAGFSHDKAGELDLIYTHTYPSKRMWTVHQMEDKGGNTADLSNPQKLRKKLKSQIVLYFDSDTSVCVQLCKGALWGRIYIHQGNTSSLNPNNVVYFVHKPKTPYIVLSKYKIGIEEFLLQSLQTSFGYGKITKMMLTGRHVDSLLQLALNRHSQGAFSKFRVGQMQNIPLMSKQPRKRKEPEYEENAGICCENKEAKRIRAEQLEETFGPNEQPLLEKLEYKVSVKFRGTQFAPAMSNIDEPFHCRVKFEGSAVLEGIRNMGKCGLATVPMPHHLSGVSSLAKNYFVLEDKKKQNKDKSQRQRTKSGDVDVSSQSRSVNN